MMVETLADGRIVSSSWDDTLRLWDGQTGKLLATLEHMDMDDAGIMDALLLPDGFILSWSGDKSPWLWNATSGVLLTNLQEEDIPQLAPDLQTARATTENDGHLVTDQHVGWGLWNTAGISQLGTPIPQVTAWQADSKATARALLADGTLIVTLASGHVFCLKLHYGARRITLTELNALYEQQAN